MALLLLAGSPLRCPTASAAAPFCTPDLRGGNGATVSEAATHTDPVTRADSRRRLPVLGAAPEIHDTQRWFNTPGGRPLTLRSLRGRVVPIDLWTYSCINCIRTLPALRAWDSRYRRDASRSSRCTRPSSRSSATRATSSARSRGTGCATRRGRVRPHRVRRRDRAGDARPPASGRGAVGDPAQPSRLPGPLDHPASHATAARRDARVYLRFSASRVFLVLGAHGGPRTVGVELDGRPRGSITVRANRLYEMVRLPHPGSHALALTFEAYPFTFG